jgi:hypothetical protein
MTDDCYDQYRENLDVLQIDTPPPPDWSYKEALASNKDFVKVLIIHGTGSGYGDILSGTYAVDRMKTRFKEAGKKLYVAALVRDTAIVHYYDVCRMRDSFDEIYPLALTLGELHGYDYLINTEQLIGDEAFETMNFYDYWLQKFGMRPEDEPKDFRLSLSPRVDDYCKSAASMFKEERPAGTKYCLLNFHATRLRAIPHIKWNDLARELAKHFTLVSVAAGSDADELSQWFAKMPDDLKGKVIDVSHITMKGWDYAAGMLRYMADVVVTPDTGLLHLAGLLNRPTVAIFPTIEPDLRISYFPTVRGYVEPSWRDNPWWGEHKAGSKQYAIVEQTDMAKQDDDYLALWEDFDPEAIAKLATEVIDVECPTPNIIKYKRNKHPRVAVFSFDRMADYFEHRLQSMLIPSVLPGDAEISWFPWWPYKYTPMCDYDLLIFGGGNGLVGPIADQPCLTELVRAAKNAIAIVGVECPDTHNEQHLSDLLAQFDSVWFRTKHDLEVYGGPNGKHLGLWQMNCFPMAKWDSDEILTLTEEPRKRHEMDHGIANCARPRRICTHHLSPLLAGLVGAEEFKYLPDLRGKARTPAKAVEPALEDIFGKRLRPDRWHKIDREAVFRYKKEQYGYRTVILRQRIKELLGRKS